MRPARAERSAPTLRVVPDIAPPAPGVRRPALRRILREPLLHFLIAGLAIFAVSRSLDLRNTRYAIDFGPAEVARLADSYEAQYGSPPTPDQLHTLIDNAVREEISLREGLALGLDRNDEIVRRRVAQKFAFLQQDLTAPPEPSDAETRRWFETHRAQYVQPAKRSFAHVYYAIERHGETGARALAEAARDRLQAAGASAAAAADPFPGPGEVHYLSAGETSRLFGGDAFAGQVFAAPVGRWSGPYRSGFGWHAVRISAQWAPATPCFADIAEQVRRDLREAERAAADDRSYAKLLARYRVHRADERP